MFARVRDAARIAHLLWLELTPKRPGSQQFAENYPPPASAPRPSPACLSPFFLVHLDEGDFIFALSSSDLPQLRFKPMKTTPNLSLFQPLAPLNKTALPHPCHPERRQISTGNSASRGTCCAPRQLVKV
jgi:hypothetical protein